MSEITPNTTLHELLKRHPGLLDFLAGYHPEFHKLRNPALRATMGRVATLERIAGLAGIPVEKLLHDIAGQVQGGDAPAAEAGDARLAKLKDILRRLHAGDAADDLRAEFADLLRETEPTEIARLEQELLREGMPVEEIHRLCDLHVNVFRDGLEQQADVTAPPGHPIHTYQAENAEIARRAQRWTDLCRSAAPELWDALSADLAAALDELAQVEIHYTRKENQLFPYLERNAFTAPSQVMWAVHDDVRRMVKEARAALARRDAAWFGNAGLELARTIVEMIYKEEKILFPNAWKLLSDDDWRAIRVGDDEIGYVVPPAEDSAAPMPVQSAASAPAPDTGLLPLTTGALTLEQLNRMLVSMPVEFSFVDEHDVVRYYSGHPDRIFPRSPAVIGRAVQNCHPPKSLEMVNSILKAFRDGERDRAEFWMNFKGRFLYITYHAVRDGNGRYLGTLEMTMDATQVRALEGERRLLDWS